jgi:uncharacterized membrane protein
MESGLEFALFLVVIILIVGPVLAIAAFVRVNHIRDLVDQVPRLTARIFDLERKISALEKATQSGSAVADAKSGEALPKPPEGIPQPAVRAPLPPPPPPGAAVAAVPISAQAGPHAASPRQTPPLTRASTVASRPDSDVETMIAGHWFYYVGILALALAVAFFLKYAFDNDWIGPTGRVAIGLLAGSALFPVSQWILGRGYTYFSEGITGLGTAILYLSIWAGWHYYALFGQTPAFVMMMVVTAVSTAVAIARDSQRIAVLALIGGVLTPTLVSTGRNAELVLFTYLAVLAAAMLVIAWRRAWKVLPPLLFVSTLFYFWAWYGEFYAPDELVTTLAFGTLFFAVFAALPAIQSLREGALTEIPDVILVAANALQFLVALRQMLWPAHRWGLTVAVLALSAAHLLAERALPEKATGAKSQVRTTRMLYAGLALVFATVAIPIRLDGYWITLAWAAEALVLVWCGLRVAMPALRVPGLLMFLIVAARLTFLPIHAGLAPPFVLNARFLVMAFCAAAGALAFYFARHSAVEIQPPESHVYFALAVAANICFLVAISWEIWDFFSQTPSIGFNRRLAQELGLSMLWVAYALAQIVPGFAWKSAALRWQGLILMGVAIAKVFLFDLSFLSSFYRIVSFFALGLVLLGVSFFYQKMARTAGQKA